MRLILIIGMISICDAINDTWIQNNNVFCIIMICGALLLDLMQIYNEKK
jgi:hypothetical protein